MSSAIDVGSTSGGGMLERLLIDHHGALLERCQSGSARGPLGARNRHDGLALQVFLRQLIGTLRREHAPEVGRLPGRSDAFAGPPESGLAALEHARGLLAAGFPIDEVVRDFGNLRQAITALAVEKRAPIPLDELQTLNRCLDNAIADAVAEFARRRELAFADREVHAVNERLGGLAHDLRNHIQTATLALAARNLSGTEGASGAVLDRSLLGMRTLIDRSLAEVRATAGLPARRERVLVAALVADLRASMALEARAAECTMIVAAVDPELAIHVERDMLFNAVANLLHNAFKFTRRHSEVALNVHAAPDHLRIEVADRCGGLPSGDPELLFRAFAQAGENRSGLGLGLAIARRSVEANGGSLTVRDVPGHGCVFMIHLPRRPS